MVINALSKRILVIFLILATLAAFPLYRLLRIDNFEDFGSDEKGYSYRFSTRFKKSTKLIFNGSVPPTWIDVHLSNHRVLRYCAENCSTSISTWRDRSGRTRVYPVIQIQKKLDAKGVLTIGGDFITHAGSITDTMHVVMVKSPDQMQRIALSNRPVFTKQIYQKAVLVLSSIFQLKKIDTPASIEDGHVQTWEYITPSPDGNYCGVSSFDGNIYVISARDGTVLWKHRIDDGTVSTIAYSTDGNYLLAGEHSIDGNFYGFDALSGKLLWKYRTAGDVGSLDNTLLVGGRWAGIVKPNAREIVAGPDTLAYGRTRRSRYYNIDGKRKKEDISRLYCLNIRTGKTEWRFPADSNLLDVSSSVINISDDGQYVSMAYFEYDRNINPVIMVFDARSGKLLWQYQTNTVERFFKSSTAYSGLCFSKDSRYGAVALNDGRVFIFDNIASVENGKGVVYNVANMTPPIDAGTIPVMTYMSKVAFTKKNDIVVLTGNTYTTPFASTKVPPVYHPHANSVFCFSIDGELQWRFTAGGNPSDLYLSSGSMGEFLVLPCAHNIRSKDINEHGFYIFDISGNGGGFSRLTGHYYTDGICVSTCFSPNQQRLFAVEAPIDMDESPKERLEGKHRILFFDFYPEISGNHDQTVFHQSANLVEKETAQ